VNDLYSYMHEDGLSTAVSTNKHHVYVKQLSYCFNGICDE